MVRKLTFQSLCRIFSSQTVPKRKLQPWCRLSMTANGGWIRLVRENFCSRHETRSSTKIQGLACDHGKQHFIMKWVCDFEGRTLFKKHSYIYIYIYIYIYSHHKRTHCFLRRIIAYYNTTFFFLKKKKETSCNHMYVKCPFNEHSRNMYKQSPLSIFFVMSTVFTQHIWLANV